MTPETTPATFLLRLVHELRTPLGSLRLLHELLESRPPCRDDAKAADYLDKMAETLRDLQDLLNQVETLGTALSAPDDSDRQVVPVADLLAELETRLQRITPEQDGPVAVTTPSALSDSLEGDRRWIAEVLEPVIEGALKVGAVDGVVVEAHPPTTAAGNAGEVLITVRDTGPPPVEPQGFFEPFAHTDPRARRAGGGRSLGLCAAERRAAGLGGRLTVARGPQGGAVFTLHLPVPAP